MDFLLCAIRNNIQVDILRSAISNDIRENETSFSLEAMCITLKEQFANEKQEDKNNAGHVIEHVQKCYIHDDQYNGKPVKWLKSLSIKVMLAPSDKEDMTNYVRTLSYIMQSGDAPHAFVERCTVVVDKLRELIERKRKTDPNDSIIEDLSKVVRRFRFCKDT